MYYFDNKYLQQYIDQQVELWVFDGYQWREVADKYDLEDPIKGYGYDVNGRGSEFKYKQIEQIKVDNKLFTLDQLQAQFTGKSSEDEPKSKGGKEPSGEDEEGPPLEEPVDKGGSEKEPDLSHYSPVYNIGRDLIREWRVRHANKH